MNISYTIRLSVVKEYIKCCEDFNKSTDLLGINYLLLKYQRQISDHVVACMRLVSKRIIACIVSDNQAK